MANITTQTIRVDMSTDKMIPTAFTHQNDTARTLVFDMYNGGMPYTMTGNTVKFAYKSPIVNGQYSVIAGASMASGTVSGNKVTVTLPVAYTQISGVGMLTMIITPTSGTVRPVNIRLVVQKAADGDDVVAGASDFPATLNGFVDDWFDNNSDEYLDAWLTGALADQDLESVVNNWLDDHPEATTTVEDGSITYSKLNEDVTDIIANDGILFESGETDNDIYTIITIPKDRYKMTLEALCDDPSESSTIDDYVRREKPFLAINISNTNKFVFNGTQYGTNYAPGTHGSTYALKSNSVDFTVLDSSLYQADIIAAGYLSACAGWNCLRLNGENLDVDYTYPTYANPNQRQTLAWDDNNWYIYTSYSRLTFCGDSSVVNKFGITMQEVLNFCVTKGWPNVAALDGGGSTYIASGKPYRRLAKNINNGYWRDAHVCIAWNERTAGT